MLEVHPSLPFLPKESLPIPYSEPLQITFDEEEFPSKLNLNNKLIDFGLNESNDPVVYCEEKTVTSLADAVAHINPNRILEESDLVKWAKLINFLVNGVEYKLIEDIDQFKKEYKAKLGAQQLKVSFPHSFMPSYNVDVINPPLFNNDKDHLIFYVHKQLIPYRVRVSALLKGTPQVYVQQLDFASN